MRAVVEIRSGCVYAISADVPCEILVVDHDDQVEIDGRAVSATTIWQLSSREGPVSMWFAEAREQMKEEMA